MVGLIIIPALLLCGVIISPAILFMCSSEVPISGRSIDLSAIPPIQTITDSVIVDGSEDLTIGYRLFLPEVFTPSQEDAKYMHERLEGLSEMLPPTTVAHQQCFYYVSQYKNNDFSVNPLKAESIRHFNNKQIMNCHTGLYITFASTDLKKGVRKKASNTSLLKKFNRPFKQPYKNYEEGLSEIEPKTLNFEDGLSSITQFEIKKMDSKDLNNAVLDYLNLSYVKPTEDAIQEIVSSIVVTPSGDLKVGQEYLATLSLTVKGENLYELNVPNTGKSKAYGSTIELPENIQSKRSMLYPVGLGLPFDHIVNVVIEITDTDATLTVINAERNGSNYLTSLYPPARDKQKQQEPFCKEITDFDYQTAYIALNMTINNPDRFSLIRKISLARQGFSFMNQSSCYIENAELCNLSFSNIPGNARNNYRGFVNMTKQAICYLQKDSIYISNL